MQQKPMLILLLILTGCVVLYFFLFGFSTDRWVRFGQWGGLVSCGFYIIDAIFRPL